MYVSIYLNYNKIIIKYTINEFNINYIVYLIIVINTKFELYTILIK